MSDFLTCSGTGSGGGGTDCIEGFAPTFTVTLPSVGTPEIGALSIPDFSGLTIEGIFKALEFLGVDPCAFIGPILGLVSGVTQGTADAITNVFQEVADMPQDVIDSIQTHIQGDINALFPPGMLAAFSDPCETLAGAANSSMEKALEVEQITDGLETDLNTVTGSVSSIDSIVNDVNIGNSTLDSRLTAGGL
jgi:hypothetical protein